VLVPDRLGAGDSFRGDVQSRVNDNAYEFIEIFQHQPHGHWCRCSAGESAIKRNRFLHSPRALYLLAPQQFAVVLDRDYFGTTPIYDALIPPPALILSLNDNTLGNAGISNSTAETVVLLDAAGQTVASYAYSLGNTDGVSDEKFILNTDDASNNWANSLHADGTPKQYNSVSPSIIDNELVARSFQFSPAGLREGQTAKLEVTVHNAGCKNFIRSGGILDHRQQRDFAIAVPLGIGGNTAHIKIYRYGARWL
jgi:hypothetical protein